MSKQISFFESLGHARDGVKAAFLDEPNFRFHIIFALIVIIMAVALKFSPEKMAILVLTISLVLTLELVNTMFEEVVNIISPDYSPKAKLIKDVSAACVLISAFLAIVVGLLLFAPSILQLLSF